MSMTSNLSRISTGKTITNYIIVNLKLTKNKFSPSKTEKESSICLA